MSTDDIFSEWKNNKVIFTGIDRIAVLTDIGFWADHINELIEWCEIHGGRVQGMTVDFDTDSQMTLFALRWA